MIDNDNGGQGADGKRVLSLCGLSVRGLARMMRSTPESRARRMQAGEITQAEADMIVETQERWAGKLTFDEQGRVNGATRQFAQKISDEDRQELLKWAGGAKKPDGERKKPIDAHTSATDDAEDAVHDMSLNLAAARSLEKTRGNSR